MPVHTSNQPAAALLGAYMYEEISEWLQGGS
eukprot:COSAG05_NODE_15048_length_380_cov_0.555160_1_plen_30_part_10